MEATANRLEAIASTAYSITLYLEGANICLDHTNNDSRVPWVFVFLDFCTQSSEVEWLISKGSFHKAVCNFRVLCCSHKLPQETENGTRAE